MGVDKKKLTVAALVLVVSYTCKDVYNIVPRPWMRENRTATKKI